MSLVWLKIGENLRIYLRGNLSLKLCFYFLIISFDSRFKRNYIYKKREYLDIICNNHNIFFHACNTTINKTFLEFDIQTHIAYNSCYRFAKALF